MFTCKPAHAGLPAVDISTLHHCHPEQNLPRAHPIYHTCLTIGPRHANGCGWENRLPPLLACGWMHVDHRGVLTVAGLGGAILTSKAPLAGLALEVGAALHLGATGEERRMHAASSLGQGCRTFFLVHQTTRFVKLRMLPPPYSTAAHQTAPGLVANHAPGRGDRRCP